MNNVVIYFASHTTRFRAHRIRLVSINNSKGIQILCFNEEGKLVEQAKYLWERISHIQIQ